MDIKKVVLGLSLVAAVSVSVNAFLAGLIIGHRPPHMDMMSGPPPMFDGPAGPPPHGAFRHNGAQPDRLQGPFQDFSRRLPEDVRASFMKALEDDRPHMEETMRAMADFRSEAAELMQAEKFDAARMRELLEEQRQVQEDAHAHIHEIIIGVLEKLEQNKRQELADYADRLFR